MTWVLLFALVVETVLMTVCFVALYGSTKEIARLKYERTRLALLLGKEISHNFANSISDGYPENDPSFRPTEPEVKN